MPKNFIEKQLSHQNKRKGILVPMLEDLMRRPVNIDTEDDIAWLTGLFQKMLERERRRTNGIRPYSPSALADCLRQVYLLSHHRRLEIPYDYLPRIEPNFYFLTGNWLHIKWLFTLHKLELAVDDPYDFKVIEVEMPLMSKHKDHGGTVDVIAAIRNELFVIDWKGLNVRAFGKIAQGKVPQEYKIQIGDYGMLWNSRMPYRGNRIERGLLIVENKGGPDSKHPIALHESEIILEEVYPEVRSRLKELRSHEQADTIPEPECISTKTIKFQGCPFARFCKEEVKEIERERRDAARKDADELELAVPPSRKSSRTERNSGRRR